MKSLRLLLVSALLSVSPLVSAQNTTPLNVGLLLPFTGDYALVGANVQPVAKMIADQVNNSGGIDGRKITLILGDAQGTVDGGFAASQKLVNVDNVLAVVGPTSLAF